MPCLEQLKALHEHDRLGLDRLHDAGLRTAVITTGELPAERQIVEALRIRYSFEDTQDKRKAYLSPLRKARLRAGYGAVREVCDFILRARHRG